MSGKKKDRCKQRLSLSNREKGLIKVWFNLFADLTAKVLERWGQGSTYQNCPFGAYSCPLWLIEKERRREGALQIKAWGRGVCVCLCACVEGQQC